MSEINYTKQPILCLHCGNETIMEMKNKIENTEYELDYDDYGNPIPIAAFYTTYYLYLCPTCDKVTLVSSESSDVETEPNGRPIVYQKTLYPVQTGEFTYIPSKIKNAYESALKVRNVDNVMCAIGLRRTLEMLCYDQNAEGKDLHKKLKYLSDKNIIPEVLDGASHLIRTIGNSAAHDNDVQFDNHIINNMIRYTRIILEYVYVIPKEIEQLQIHFEKEKTMAEKGQ